MTKDEETKVYIKNIGIKNFKSIENGELSLKTGKRRDAPALLGIVGQNGSGKSSVIETLRILKSLLVSRPLENDLSGKILQGQKNAEFSFEFEIQTSALPNSSYSVFYGFKLSAEKEETLSATGAVYSIERPNIFDEYLKIQRPKHNSLTITIGRSPSSLLSAVPKKSFNTFQKELEKQGVFSLIIDREITYSKCKSYLFSSKFQHLLKSFQTEELDLVSAIIQILKTFGQEHFFIVENPVSGVVRLDILPVSFNHTEDKKFRAGTNIFDLFGNNYLPKSTIPFLKRFASKLSLVAAQLIPGIELQLKEADTAISPQGIEIEAVYLTSLRDGKEIPLKEESAGIKKIISILPFLIAVYNCKGITVAIDDIDSTIFEYLLGELLALIQDGGKGQLIFTCHNLRPLELLSPKSIGFTSTDPAKRFTHYCGVQKTNNLRDLFYREILVGLQDRPLYQPTNNSDIAAAFRTAGWIIHGDSNSKNDKI